MGKKLLDNCTNKIRKEGKRVDNIHITQCFTTFIEFEKHLLIKFIINLRLKKNYQIVDNFDFRGAIRFNRFLFSSYWPLRAHIKNKRLFNKIIVFNSSGLVITSPCQLK